ncbi:acyl-CoA dehydrogenase family protein [Aliiglaciecola sp. LCG003]|uniref:acyl-CoA dehydrogenase family protein n=1 Tax=Aliiglaciecola sp. LCG003 TaxID=3053655 RepID=UPI002573BA68|nr:acyl-CoA dehydrogenase family protein [Aliiglaciecola sp. LCG003]WJG08080.1 acyl-CoA dehydrogenase family protein [Aliiglaciecola sp. LCG003]
MDLTQEHEALRKTVRDFVDREMDPFVEEWESAGKAPLHSLFKKMGDLGLLGIHKPEAFGGSGLDYSYNLVFAEEIGRAYGGSLPMAIGVQTDMATPALARFGSDELKRDFLAPAIAGDMVACIGVSEPGAGSDVAGLKTNAKSDGDDYVINGSKMWITNATQGDWICLLANTSDGNVHANKSLIIVPLDSPGIEISKPLNKMGMRASDTAQIFFDNVRVPKRNRIGEENRGFAMQMMQFQEERIYAAAGALKGMERIIQDTIQWCRERHTFGQPVLNNQVVHFKLAELQTEVEALRALTWKACHQHVNGEDATYLASMAKLKSGRLWREVTDGCLQYWGGMGFMWDNVVARAYRDSRILSIAGGSDEMMLGIIAKHMDIFPKRR